MNFMTDFDARTAIEIGGWDPRYARVIDLQVDGDTAAALVDANGDGADLNVDVYFRGRDGQWAEVASGNGSIEAHGVLATWTDDDRLTLTRTDKGVDGRRLRKD
ncbi:hypothetical protein J2S59_000454 [Nocardioides massiliensis]|uniref:Uncharacterized protein n=2 Tax=Nocardioides massiliensis TaxID=1325935 RepID=A0ABT9NJQ2_9ACTN|nr:hypothetical protein [Nocardioides massiliensis]MDP9820645.1 hypothetical protein [Nocardioides massiliensis]